MRKGSRILSSVSRLVQNSGKDPCLEEIVLYNKQCHLLGGIGTMPLWSAGKRFLKGQGGVWLGFFPFSLMRALKSKIPEVERQC